MPNASHDTRLSRRLAAVRPSATGAISEAARHLAEQGHKVISLSEGELDFDTPSHIQNAAIQGIREGHTRYTNVGGTSQLKAAIARKFLRDNDLKFLPNEIVASTGAKQILFNAMLATLNPGDEAIMVAPYWVSYSEMVRIAGGEPVVAIPNANDDFKLTPALLRASITKKTRWLILNSPGNPSGALYSAKELQEIAIVLDEYPNAMVLSDDIYEAIIFAGKFVTFAQVNPRMQDRTLTINGVSKAYAMTGWRLGYAGGPAWLIKALELLQSQSTSNPSSVSQVAAIAALDGPQEFLSKWRHQLRVRRDLAIEALSAVANILQVTTPPAAFYLYANCSAALGMQTSSGDLIRSDSDLALYLLQDAGVAVVPGTAFGLAPYLRIAYGVSDSELLLACQLVVAAIQRLTKP